MIPLGFGMAFFNKNNHMETFFAILTLIISGFLFYKFVKMRKETKTDWTNGFEIFVNICGVGCLVAFISIIVYLFKNLL